MASRRHHQIDTRQALSTASATSTGDGRNGHVRTADGVPDLAVPTEMGGPGGALTNPEELQVNLA